MRRRVGSSFEGWAPLHECAVQLRLDAGGWRPVLRSGVWAPGPLAPRLLWGIQHGIGNSSHSPPAFRRSPAFLLLDPTSESCREFVVNIISDWFVEAANHTCGDFERGVDEMKLAGLTPVLRREGAQRH